MDMDTKHNKLFEYCDQIENDSRSMGMLEIKSNIDKMEEQVYWMEHALAHLKKTRSNLCARLDVMKENARRELDQLDLESLAESKGYKIGDIFYRERSEGFFILKSIQGNTLGFERHFPIGHLLPRNAYVVMTNLPVSMRKLKEKGPFRVGEVVMYGGSEYVVEGYFGYQVCLSIKIEKIGKVYTGVKHKEVTMYKSIMI